MLTAIATWESPDGERTAVVDPESLRLELATEVFEVVEYKKKLFQFLRKKEVKRRYKMPGNVESRSVVRLIVDEANRGEIEQWLESRVGIATDYKKDVTLGVGLQRFTLRGAWPNPVGESLSDFDQVELVHDDIREVKK